jgi:hypothetical protein
MTSVKTQTLAEKHHNLHGFLPILTNFNFFGVRKNISELYRVKFDRIYCDSLCPDTLEKRLQAGSEKPVAHVHPHGVRSAGFANEKGVKNHA